MQTKFGSYSGTGVDNLAITGVGFQPDVVIIKRQNTGDTGFFRTASMASGNSMTLRGDSGLTTGRIKTLDSDGFTLGTGAEVNASGVTFYYFAFKKTSANDFDYGTYTGNGSDNRNITLQSNFPFTWLVIKGDGGRTGAYRNKDVSGDNTHAFYFTGYNTDQIQSMSTTTGDVQLGTSDFVNSNTRTYYWFGFKEVDGFCTSFTYTGNGSDNRDITIPGTSFQPGFVWLKRQDTSDPRIRNSAYTGDSSQSFDGATETNSIQGFNSTGFQVGNNSQVNNNTSTYHVLAIKEGTSASSTVNVGAQTGSFSIAAVTAVGAALVTASLLSAAFSLPAATVRGAASINVAAQTNTLTLPAPTVGGAGQTSPGALSGSFSLPAASASGGAVNAFVSPVTATLSLAAPTATGSASTTAAVQMASFSVPAVTASGGASTNVSAQSVALTVLSVTARGAGQASPASVTASFSIPAPTIQAGAIIAVSTVSASLSVPSVTVEGAGSVSAGAQTGSFSILAPTVTGAASVSVAAQTGSLSVPPAVGSGAGSIQVGVQGTAFTIPSVSASGAAEAICESVTGTVSLPPLASVTGRRIYPYSKRSSPYHAQDTPYTKRTSPYTPLT